MVGERMWRRVLVIVTAVIAAGVVVPLPSASASPYGPVPESWGSIPLNISPPIGAREAQVTITPSKPCPAGASSVRFNFYRNQQNPGGTAESTWLRVPGVTQVAADGWWSHTTVAFPEHPDRTPGLLAVEAECMTWDAGASGGTGGESISMSYFKTYVRTDGSSYWLVEACFVNKTYQDLLRREPEPGAYAWTDALRAGTPRINVAYGITASYEFRSRLVSDLYREFLGRQPDPTGLQHWVNGLNRGMTIEHVEALFVSSPEKYAQAGGTDRQWVRYLYQAVLGRTASESEVDGWVATLNRGSDRIQVAGGFVISTERLSTRVEGYYQSLLNRGTDPVGRNGWVRAIQNGTRTETVIGSIIASAEYYSSC